MALQEGIDTVAIASFGSYTETYGSSEPANIANLAASFGYLEDAPNLGFNIIPLVMHLLRRVLV